MSVENILVLSLAELTVVVLEFDDCSVEFTQRCVSRSYLSNCYDLCLELAQTTLLNQAV